jgi:hypothetical protein
MKRNKKCKEPHKGMLDGNKKALSAWQRKEWIDHNSLGNENSVGGRDVVA